MLSDYINKKFTLDWDNISINTADQRISFIKDNYPEIIQIEFSQSATKGFHVTCICNEKVNVAQYRNELKDDGNRLVHDLIDRIDKPLLHDIFWQEKHLNGLVWYEELLWKWSR
jgi:hypothetical protein